MCSRHQGMSSARVPASLAIARYREVMPRLAGRLIALGALALCAGATPSRALQAAPGTVVVRPAPPGLVADVQIVVEQARQRFEARDAAGVLAYVSEQYRSGGFTKGAVRQQLNGMFALYDEMRARVAIDKAEVADAGVWLYTTGEISGHLPFVGWVTVMTWRGEPEVVRREGAAWRLFGFQT
jgi:hypothetical protein